MILALANNPAELATLITEMDQNLETIEDITCERVGEMHIHSGLIGILDATRHGDASWLGL